MSYAAAVNVLWYGADETGVVDSSLAFQQAISTGAPVIVPPGRYYFAKAVVPPAGGDLTLHGEGRPVIVAAKGVIAFTTKQDYPFGFVRRVNVSGIIFDGERVRRTFPYMESAGDVYGMFTALQLAAAPGDTLSSLVVTDCEFRNMASLPVLIDRFQRVSVQGCVFDRTRDPGFRFCNNLVYSGNTTRFGSDNGVSVSRGCRNVTVTGNIMQDCEAAGIWLSGFDVPISGRTMTIAGASYGTGAAVNIAVSGSPFFRQQHLSNMFTVTDANGIYGVVAVKSITGANTVTGAVLVDIPPSLQGSPASTFQEGPENGVENFTVTGNVIIGGYIAGVHAIEAPQLGTIGNNVIKRSGYLGDSEVSTKGSVFAGTDALTVLDGSLFSVGDVLLLQPDSSLFDEAIVTVKAINSNVILLKSVVSRSLVDVEVRLCRLHPSSGYGIFIAGQATGIKSYAENIGVTANIIDETLRYGVVIGTNGIYPARNITISGNRFSQRDNPAASIEKSAVHISEAPATAIARITLTNNNVDDGHARIVNLLQRGDSLRSVCIRNNIASETVPDLRALDVDNSSSVVNGYVTSKFTQFGVGG